MVWICGYHGPLNSQVCIYPWRHMTIDDLFLKMNISTVSYNYFSENINSNQSLPHSFDAQQFKRIIIRQRILLEPFQQETGLWAVRDKRLDEGGVYTRSTVQPLAKRYAYIESNDT